MESNANPVGFVEYVIRKVNSKAPADKHFRAVMRRADNPAFESAAWEYLIPFCDIEKEYERLPFAVVGAAIAKAKPEKDGEGNLGNAFHQICKNKDDMERESRRFRRLLAADTTGELCEVLRPALHYLTSKEATIGYAQLLKDVIYWRRKTKQFWAKEFYNRKSETLEDTEA